MRSGDSLGTACDPCESCEALDTKCTFFLGPCDACDSLDAERVHGERVHGERVRLRRRWAQGADSELEDASDGSRGFCCGDFLLGCGAGDRLPRRDFPPMSLWFFFCAAFFPCDPWDPCDTSFPIEPFGGPLPRDSETSLFPCDRWDPCDPWDTSFPIESFGGRRPATSLFPCNPWDPCDP